MNPPNRRRAALYLAAVFLAGALAGVAGGYAFGRRPVFRPPPSPDQMAEMIVERFTRELGLTPDQQEKLRPIARDSSTAMETLHRDTHEKVIALFQETHQRVRAFLTPDQVEKLRAFEAREARKFGGGQPPPR
jgi:Spy/CpxP family protein refolding chaperone